MIRRLGSGALLLSTALSAQTQSPVFSAKVEVVRVDALVTDGGRPCSAWAPRTSKCWTTACHKTWSSSATTDSVERRPGVRHERQCGRRAPGAPSQRWHRGARWFEAQQSVGARTFNNQVMLGAALTSDFDPLREAIGNVVGEGDTSLVDGVYAGITVGESDAGRALLIVFSDGLDTLSWLSSAAVLDTAKRSDVVVYAVAVGKVKVDFLRDLASFSGGRLFELEKTANLSATFLSILEEFRQRYLVSYTPRGVSRDGWHRLEVRLKGRRAAIKARPGYPTG